DLVPDAGLPPGVPRQARAPRQRQGRQDAALLAHVHARQEPRAAHGAVVGHPGLGHNAAADGRQHHGGGPVGRHHHDVDPRVRDAPPRLRAPLQPDRPC
ncbi:hypothetical protein BN1708_020191, partial [Verticillium longisporum]